MTLAWFVVLVVAFGLGVLEWLVSPKDFPLTLAADVATGWAFSVAGLIAWGGRRPRTIALLLEATGFTWLLGSLVPSMLDLYRGPLVHFLLAYPSGRLPGRVARAIVALAYLSGVLGQLAPVQLDGTNPHGNRRSRGDPGCGRRHRPRARGRGAAALAAVAVATTAGVLTLGTVLGWLDPDSGRLAYAVVLGATRHLPGRRPQMGRLGTRDRRAHGDRAWRQ